MARAVVQKLRPSIFLIPAFVFFFDMLFPLRRRQQCPKVPSLPRPAVALLVCAARRWKARRGGSPPSATTSSTIAPLGPGGLKSQGPIWLGSD